MTESAEGHGTEVPSGAGPCYVIQFDGGETRTIPRRVLSGVNLDYVCLDYSRIWDICFDGGSMRYASLRYCDLTGTDFSKLDLTGVNLEGAYTLGQTVWPEDFPTHLHRFINFEASEAARGMRGIRPCPFTGPFSESSEGLDFSQGEFRRCWMEDVTFKGCRFQKCKFVAYKFERCRFEECSFDECVLSECLLVDTEFVNCSFRGALLTSCRMLRNGEQLNLMALGRGAELFPGAFIRWVPGLSGRPRSLQEGSLVGRDLSGVDLRGYALSVAETNSSNLAGARLDRSSLVSLAMDRLDGPDDAAPDSELYTPIEFTRLCSLKPFEDIRITPNGFLPKGADCG